MKRWIHDSIDNISKAKKELLKYSDEQVKYVRDCQDEIVKAISDSYFDENGEYLEENRPIGSKLSEIKRDYMVGAIEEDLMTEEEFEDILSLLDIVDIEYSMPYI